MKWSHTLQAGGKWSGTIRKGSLIKLTTNGAGGNLAFMLFHASQKEERYSMPDTLKAQHTSMLTKGNVLMSDNGRVMTSIVEDTVGWHDPVSSYITRKQTDEKYGETSFQEHLNEWHRSSEENFAIELIRQSLELRDMGPVVNVFSKVNYQANGAMAFSTNHSQEGDYIVLRTEMDLLFLCSNTPHPLNPSKIYPSEFIHIEVSDAPPVAKNDCCVNHCEENKRAFENTWAFELLTKKSENLVII